MSEALVQDFANAILALFIAAVPLAIYAAVVRKRAGLSLVEIRERAGLVIGPVRWMGISMMVTVAFLPLMLAQYLWMKEDMVHEMSPLLRFVDLGIGPEALVAAFLYGMIGTGLWEEVFFRGLVAGALFRRYSFWVANTIQAVIFLLPHLLILIAEPGWWFFLIPFVMVFGLVLGWLRHRSDSIVPCWIVHGVGNTSVALMVVVI